MEKIKRIFSGIQPTGHLHLGNYLGALDNFVKLQDHSDHDCLYCIVDLHAITIFQEPMALQQSIYQLTACFLACGLDPKRSILFNQSKVLAHGHMAWLLNSIVRIGWLNRMTQFKDKAGKNREQVSVGLYNYPVLMAADILLYQADLVPIGEDQKQHLELTRDIAIKFNQTYGINFFVTPEPLFNGAVTRLMSLRDGKVKMSKSDPSEYSRIHLDDDNDVIAAKIRKAKTDSLPFPMLDEDLSQRPEVANLIKLYIACSGRSRLSIYEEFSGKPLSLFKQTLMEAVVMRVEPIRHEMRKILKDHVYLETILRDGARRASEIADNVIGNIHKIMGMR